MKKMYIFAAACIAATQVFAQDTNDSLTFESVNLAPDDYYNGSDDAGQIVIGDIVLSNYYDQAWASWSGFAVSNVVDVTTPGFSNQYASYAGGGAASENYGVFYYDGDITFAQDRVVTSIDITNTTYAGLSMLNGDSYSKQFGSINGADGNPDGTNGEDFFLLQIVALDDQDQPVADTVEFYLADYRFSDDNQDYIVDAWETVDFQPSTIARKLKFILSSSDNGQFGMNTPAYFALDNLVSAPAVSGIQEAGIIALEAYPNPFNTGIRVKTQEEVDLSISTGSGAVVLKDHTSGESTYDLSELPAGIYFLTVRSSNGQSTQKLIKR